MLRLILLAFLLISACTAAPSSTPADVVETQGNIELNQGMAPDMGGGGRGTLFFNGRTHRFSISGVGVEGSGIAILRTTGQVSQLRDLSAFPGTYRKASSNGPSAGLWLRNEHGTLMRIAAPSQGRIPEIGQDAVRVELL